MGQVFTEHKHGVVIFDLAHVRHGQRAVFQDLQHQADAFQFTGFDAGRLPMLKVRKDGGEIAYHTGATISARAVTNAVARAARYAADNQNRLFAAPSGSTL